jgi:CRP/FNR family cyclic AMP-dependent transcriptional regulator
MDFAKEPVDPSQLRRDSHFKLGRSLLGRAIGFKLCKPETLDALMNEAFTKSLSKSEVLAHHGDNFDCLCMVLEGSLEVSNLRRDGHRHLIHFMQPGDLLGFINMLDGQGLVNDLISRFADTTVLMVTGDRVRSLRQKFPDLSTAIEMQVAFRSRLLYERLAADPSMPLENRLAKLLLTLATLYGLQRDDGILLDVRISQADLADWLGVSRQRINSATQLLKQEGLLNLGYSSIIIKDIEALKLRTSV